jgi:hypothetical protein
MIPMPSAAAGRPLSLVLLGAVGLSAAACPSLAGFSGDDASTDGRPIADAGNDSDRPSPGDGAAAVGVRCMKNASPSLEDSVYCNASEEECCVYQPGDEATLSCVKSGMCSGMNQTEIQCDTASQCGDKPCRICLQANYVSGTSCDPGEIVDGDGCHDLMGTSEAGFFGGILCTRDGGDEYCESQGLGGCGFLNPPPVGFVLGWFSVCSPKFAP